MIRLEGTAHDSIFDGEIDYKGIGKVKVYGDPASRGTAYDYESGKPIPYLYGDAEKNYLEISERQLAQNVIALFDQGGTDAVQRFLDNYQTNMANVVSAVMGENAEDSDSVGHEVLSRLVQVSKNFEQPDTTEQWANNLSDEKLLKEHQHFSGMKALEDEQDPLEAKVSAQGANNKLLTIARNTDQMSTNELGKALKDVGMLGFTDKLDY